MAAVLNGTNGSLQVYVGGVLVTQKTTTIRPLRDLDPAFHPGLAIGDSAGTISYAPYTGLIDEISLYARALDSTEIQAIFAAGSAGQLT